MSTTSVRLTQSESSLIKQEDEKATYAYFENKTPPYKKLHSLRFIDSNNLELQTAVSLQQSIAGKIEMDQLVVSLISAIRIKKESLSPLSDESDAYNYNTGKKTKHKHKHKSLQKRKSVPVTLQLQQVSSSMFSAPELNIIYESKQPNISISKYSNCKSRGMSSTPTPKCRKPRSKKYRRIKRAKTVNLKSHYIH